MREPNDLDTAFKLLSNEHVQVVVILANAMLFQERQRVAELAASARLPAVYGFRDHVDAGGRLVMASTTLRTFVVRPSMSSKSLMVPGRPICRSNFRTNLSW